MGLLFVLYPIAEIVAWISFIQKYSFLDGVLWCFLSAAVGIFIMRLQGSAAFQELQQSAQQGRLPSSRATHHLLMSFGGILLILPGLLSDILGALLILPGTRHLFVWWIYKKTGGAISKGFAGFSNSGSFGTSVFTKGFGGPQGPMGSEGSARTRDVSSSGEVIDVKATVVQDSLPPLKDRKDES